MSLSGQDLTEPISEGGSHVFRLTGFLSDDQRLHDGSRPFRTSVPRLPYVEHNRNSISLASNRLADDLSSETTTLAETRRLSGAATHSGSWALRSAIQDFTGS